MIPDESVAELPTVMAVAERLVAIVGLALLTVIGSHGDDAPLLFASPLYVAFQLYGPATLKGCKIEPGIAPPVTVTGVPAIVPVPVQVDPVKYS